MSDERIALERCTNASAARPKESSPTTRPFRATAVHEANVIVTAVGSNRFASIHVAASRYSE